MKTAILILAFLFAGQSLLAQNSWQHVKNLPGHVLDLQSPNDSIVYAYFDITSEYDPIYQTTDFGRTWNEVYKYNPSLPGEEPPLQAFYYLVPTTNKHIVSYIRDQRIFIYSDPNENPESYSTPIMGSMNALTMIDSLVGMGYFITHYEELEEPPYRKAFTDQIITFDGWKTSFTRDSYLDAYNDSYVLNDEMILLYDGRDFRPLLISYDIYKDKYTEISHFEPHIDSDYEYQNSVSEFEIINDSVFIGVGYRYTGLGDTQADLIFKSIDAGRNWRKILDTVYDAHTSNPWGLQDVSFYDDRNGVAVGAWGKIYLTRDGGESWYCEDPLPEYFIRYGDATYGPPVMKVAWAGKTPVIGTRLGGNMYRYEGDYFDWSIAAPRLFEPKNWVKGQETVLRFRWEEVEGINEYHFELAKDKEFTEIIEDQMVSGIELDVSGLETHTTYHWRVTIRHEGEDYISREFYFRTKFDDLKTLTPDCNAIDQSTDLELSWTPAGGAEYYHLQIADDEEFTSIINDLDSLSETSYELTELDSGRTYYWRVQSLDYKERSDWSEVCSFTTDHPTSVFSFLDAGEIDITQFDDEIHISIQGGSAIDYKFQLYNLQGQKIIEQKISRNVQTNIIKLDKLLNGSYLYRVSTKGVPVLQDKLNVVE